ncbi:hypothetical protein CIB48_g7208 [Xylaria polymorpha]|nr:hypothetical protein CIB48_g7208 [Xylaria polymorpha]
MYIICVFAVLVVTTAAAVTLPAVPTGELVKAEPQTMQDSAIPYCQCTAQQLFCCSDAGCQVLGSCSG